jgi:hypothetical protein
MPQYLKSEDPKQAQSALNAFFQAKNVHPNGRPFFVCHHEHGQLWINGRYGLSYSVVDAEGPGSTNGFDFEQISEDEN